MFQTNIPEEECLNAQRNACLFS